MVKIDPEKVTQFEGSQSLAGTVEGTIYLDQKRSLMTSIKIQRKQSFEFLLYNMKGGSQLLTLYILIEYETNKQTNNKVERVLPSVNIIVMWCHV